MIVAVAIHTEVVLKLVEYAWHTRVYVKDVCVGEYSLIADTMLYKVQVYSSEVSGLQPLYTKSVEDAHYLISCQCEMLQAMSTKSIPSKPTFDEKTPAKKIDYPSFHMKLGKSNMRLVTSDILNVYPEDASIWVYRRKKHNKMRVVKMHKLVGSITETVIGEIALSEVNELYYAVGTEYEKELDESVFDSLMGALNYIVEGK